MADDKSRDINEIIRQGQDDAIRLAMENAKAMFGNIPGFQMPDQEMMKAMLDSQLDAVMPDLQQSASAYGTYATDPDAIRKAMEQNMAYAREMSEAAMNGSLADILSAYSDDAEEEWQVLRADDGSLNEDEQHLMAFGAPLYVYNGEFTDSIAADEDDIDTMRSTLESWWDVTDHDSALGIFSWLLNEGHHAAHDPALAYIAEKGFDSIPADEGEELGDAFRIASHMIDSGICDSASLPATAIGWDLARATECAKWSYCCGYIQKDEMWNVMGLIRDIAKRTFSSWSEYGLSYVIGRGVWHGDEDDADIAYEVYSALMGDENSPWLRIEW